MRCSARRSRAAATISIARVIFCTFFTEAMRFLTSLRVAIRSGYAVAPASSCSAWAPASSAPAPSLAWALSRCSRP